MALGVGLYVGVGVDVGLGLGMGADHLYCVVEVLKCVYVRLRGVENGMVVFQRMQAVLWNCKCLIRRRFLK